MSSYFPLLGLAMAAAFAVAMMKFNDYMVRRGREEEERQRKEAEAAQQLLH